MRYGLMERNSNLTLEFSGDGRLYGRRPLE